MGFIQANTPCAHICRNGLRRQHHTAPSHDTALKPVYGILCRCAQQKVSGERRKRAGVLRCKFLGLAVGPVDLSSQIYTAFPVRTPFRGASKCQVPYSLPCSGWLANPKPKPASRIFKTLVLLGPFLAPQHPAVRF